MNEYEEQQLNSFFSLFLDNYIQNLIDQNIVDFKVAVPLDTTKVPFAVYSNLSAKIISDLSNNQFGDYYESIILKDAYLYTYYKQDDNTASIRNTIENNDLATIAYFLGNNQLLSTAIIKAFINYILLIKEDISYKDILIEEIDKNGKKDVLKKFKNEPKNINSVNYYFKAMLVDKTNALIKVGTDETHIMPVLDEYFYNGFDIESDESEYFKYLRDFSKEKILEEQIRMIYEVAFITLSSQKFDEDENIQEEIIEYILNHYKDDPLELPDNKKIRWILYDIFINYAFDVGSKIEALSDDNKGVVAKLVPSYFLDMLD